MPIRLYIGDSHGNFDNFNAVAQTAIKELDKRDLQIEEVISVGDFGYWPRLLRNSYKKSSNITQNVSWIDGNHEEFASLIDDSFPNPNWECNYIPRGTIRDGIFFMGGATSIDKLQRKIGIDWFDEENISYPDFYCAESNILENKEQLSIMCCHDSIMNAYPYLLDGNKGNNTSDPNAQALQSFFEMIRPKVYIHGHHHVSAFYKIDNTSFISLDRCCRKNADYRFCTIAVSDDGTIYKW